MTSEHQPNDTSMPPMVPSMEATKEQLQLAKQQGDAYRKALENMHKETGQLAVKRAGDFEIGATVEEAEGMYRLDDGEYTWISPKGENAHLEIVVRDAADGRFIPGLDVSATIYSSDGNEVGTHKIPFLWHPMLYHYGRNLKVPCEGDYRVHVRVEPPTFMRHDYKNGKRYAQREEVDVTLHIKPGQKFVKGKEEQVR